MLNNNYKFHESSLTNGLKSLFQKLESELNLQNDVKAYIAGGMAVHIYTGERVTFDVDAEFCFRFLMPKDLFVEIQDDKNNSQLLFFDTNYNPMFSLMHENYIDDAILLKLGTTKIKTYLLSPTDLAISKIARFSPNDKSDIAALVRRKLTTSAEIEVRASEALNGYIGNHDSIIYNIRDAINMTKRIESDFGNSLAFKSKMK